MKRYFILLSLLSLFIIPSIAQINVGILGGVQSIDVAQKPLVISSEESLNDFLLTAQNSDLGIHFGVFARFQIKSIFLQPEVIFNSNKINYKWENINNTNQPVKYLSETYQYIDIPIKIGFKKGPFVIHSGPVGHYFVNSTSELWQIKDYDQKFDNFKWSWQFGAGIEFLFLKFDIHYERDLTAFGDQIELFGKEYQFDKTVAKWVASAYLSF